MTIATQVKQTAASLKGAQAVLEMMASFAKNPEIGDILRYNSERINAVTMKMEDRIAGLEFLEPSYKGF